MTLIRELSLEDQAAARHDRAVFWRWYLGLTLGAIVLGILGGLI